MKLCAFLFSFITITAYGASEEKKSFKACTSRGKPKELISAMRDLQNAGSNKELQKTVLNRIDMALLGGAQLEETDYSLQTIIKIFPEDELWKIARAEPFFGIIRLLNQHHAARFAAGDA